MIECDPPQKREKPKHLDNCFGRGYPNVVNAEFPGGTDSMYIYIQNNLNYGRSCAQGKVFVEFVIDTSGNVVYPKIIKGIGEPFDNNALEAIKNMPKWIPATSQGQKIKQTYKLPIVFTLD